MARKTGLSLKDVMREEFIALAEYQAELARETYFAQDSETQDAIDKMASVLAQYSTGSTFDVSEEVLDKALSVIVMEVVKDLALLDIRVANFTFIEGSCVKCGGEV